MKVNILFVLILFSFSIVKAQTMPEAFIGMLPDPPTGICSTNDGENSPKSDFIGKISDVKEKLDEEISRRKHEMERKMENNEDKMMQNAMARTGVSPQLAQQMMALEKAKKGATGDQKKAIDAQIKALAGKMVEESTNISMGEIDNLKKMDKEGQKAWATAYATEKQAEVMADPKAYQDKNAAAMKDYQLLQKQKQLSDSLNAQAMKYWKQFEELEADQQAQAMLSKIDKAEARLSELYKQENRPNDNEIRSLVNQIREIETNYCNLQTPKYINILSRYISFMQASLTPYYRLEKLTNQVMASQTGVKIDAEPGLMGLESVKAYLGKLSDVYRFSHIRPEMVYIGAE